ncbi:MAG: hypothetical protein AAGJ18_04665 [Bacteroidota bacterium]
MEVVPTTLLKEVEDTCQQLEKEFSLIPTQRKRVLYRLSEYITHKFQHRETPQLIVICTHNSRRSHFGQIWLAVGAAYYGLPKIATFSGGTEATAFNLRAVNALQKLGFDIRTKEHKSPSNPIYEVNWLNEAQPYEAFSKKYDNPPNPFTNFGAIMVCTSADEGCPIVSGADFRLTLPFEDPKAFDNTPLESRKYIERSRQIGREMLYVLSQVKP